MKNFYESTIINTDNMLTINIIIQPIHYNRNKMSCEFYINDNELYKDTPTEKLNISFSSDLLTPLTFKFVVYGKQLNDTCECGDVALLIENITVNNHDITTQFEMNARYISDNQLISSSRYMGFNGVQNFSINKPFYHWLHNVSHWGWIA